MGFQFKKELAELILAGKKTQTRRPRKGDELWFYMADEVRRNGRLLWQVGRTYAVQPGRGKKGIGFITVKNIRCVDARSITRADAIAEGFNSRLEFIKVWCGFYDPQVQITPYEGIPDKWNLYAPDPLFSKDRWWLLSEDEVIWHLRRRSPNNYLAYAIDFELVKSEAVQS